MEIFPAIDLRGGQVVRLTEGDYHQMEAYGVDPVETAKGFAKAGAKYLHIVDLDGAKDGTNPNAELIRSIVQAGGLFAQVGGGIRDEARIQSYLNAGVGRVILGTVAAENPEFVRDMVKKYGEKIAVSLDAKDGRVAVKGWLEVTDLDSLTYAQKLAEMGVKTIIYTDISKDGKMEGTNLEIYQALKEKVSADLIASGGITYEEEITALRNMGIYGAIVGKALYEKGLDLARLIALGGE